MRRTRPQIGGSGDGKGEGEVVVPHAWERFPVLKRFYGGIKTLVPSKGREVEWPRAEDGTGEQGRLEAEAWAQKLDEDVVHPPTEGGFQKRDESSLGDKIPKGIRFDPYSDGEKDESYERKIACSALPGQEGEIPHLLAYEGLPQGFPEPAYGSHELLGLRNDICFERFGRYGPYGLGYSQHFGGTGAGMEGDRLGADQVWEGEEFEVDFRAVNWTEAQLRCMRDNAHRFRPTTQNPETFFAPMNSAQNPPPPSPQTSQEDIETLTSPNGKKLKTRSAVIIRTWRDYTYDPEDILYLRALINELALQSGTEYVVHFLIHVKNNDKRFYTTPEAYAAELADALPAEFAGMGTLWSERQIELLYPGLEESHYRDLPVYGVYRSTYLPLQYFAHLHPQYDFFWHWEMDARYTGHFGHLFTQIASWARQQPRKELWERNSRFFVPGEHGSWENFTAVVHEQTLQGRLIDGKGPIWGPHRPEELNMNTYAPELDPKPPGPEAEDQYSWGVGEEADLITFNPLFDPHLTNWILAEDVTGYPVPPKVPTYPPRRIAIITASRLSRRLLSTMHFETREGKHTMFSEMWPGSCALHHGFKAVYAPHPVYMERAWPSAFLAATFNDGANGASGGSRLSVFSDERQHNFLPSTWYYHAQFAPRLWRRWFGYRAQGEGGEEWETSRVKSPVLGGEGREGQGEEVDDVFCA